MKKLFWFPFDVTAWLSSRAVRMMSLAERGAFIGLLATAWGEDVPGTLPADDDYIRRLADMTPEQWQVSGPVLLAEFPLSECKTFRYNERLCKDRDAQMAIKEENSRKGQKSAEKRKLTKGQPNGNSGSTAVENPATPVENNSTDVVLDKDKVKGTTDVVPPMQASSSAAKVYPTLDDTETCYRFADSLFCNATVWPTVCDDFRKAPDYAEVNFDHYREEIRLDDLGKNQCLPNRHWRKKLQNWLKNDLTANKLVKVAGRAVPMQRSEKEIQFLKTPEAEAREANTLNIAAAALEQRIAARNAGQLPGSTVTNQFS